MEREATTPRILVVVPARNAAATIGDTLAALARQDVGEPFETVVVDDGSSDDTADIAASSDLRPAVIRLDRSLGAGSARNAGARGRPAEYLAFTDSDCAPEPEWLRESLAAVAELDLLQGMVLPAGPGGPFDRTVQVTSAGGFYETANLIVRRSVFERVGGFEDLLRPREQDKGIGEDVIFGWRVRRAGGRVGFSRRSIVRHAVFARGPLAYIRERVRLWYFPFLFRHVPELRRERAFGRIFLSRRTASFDLAAVAVAVAAAGAPVALIGIAPYLVVSYASATRAGRRRAPLVAVVDVAADAVGLLSLLAGSAQSRRLLL